MWKQDAAHIYACCQCVRESGSAAERTVRTDTLSQVQHSCTYYTEDSRRQVLNRKQIELNECRAQYGSIIREDAVLVCSINQLSQTHRQPFLSYVSGGFNNNCLRLSYPFCRSGRLQALTHSTHRKGAQVLVRERARCRNSSVLPP
jgi:hypothetical protein